MASKSSRTFFGVLYPDSESYDCSAVLAALSDVFHEYAYCLHDRDVNDEGELLKPHYHWVGKRNPATAETVANGLGVPANSVEYCKKWKSAVRYLIHLDDPDKVQYDAKDVTANFRVEDALALKDETARAQRIYIYINDHPGINVNALAQWSFENDCWSEFRRSFSIWCKILHDLGGT